MSDKKPIDQFLFEYNEFEKGYSDTNSVDSSSGNSFSSMKGDQGSYQKMLSILAGNENFEFSLLDRPKMVRALIDQVKIMAKNRDKFNAENKSVAKRIKELEKIKHKTLEDLDELASLIDKNKSYQLQKTLIRLDNKFSEVDDILKRIENGVEITDKTRKKYDDIVGEIENVLFQETYLRRNLPYDRGEASAIMMQPTATQNFPIKFISDNGKTYYGIIRPPSGIITWEGREARDAWLQDSAARLISDYISSSGRFTSNELLKIRISNDNYTALTKEILNDKLFSLRMPNGVKKIEYDDSSKIKEAIRNFIFNEIEDGKARVVHDYDVMDGDSIEDVINKADEKKVMPSLDKRGRPKDLTSIINSIEFWRFIRGLI